MNYKIFHSIFYISIICQKKRHTKIFKAVASKRNHIKLDRKGLIVIQYGVIRCKTVAVSFFFGQIPDFFHVFQLIAYNLRKIVEIFVQNPIYRHNLKARANTNIIQ